MVVSTLLGKQFGIIDDYSLAKFKQKHVSNWIQNKSKDKPFVHVILKCDHFQSTLQDSSTLNAEIHEV